jgi:NADH-quinone oxidoreductase subunit H
MPGTPIDPWYVTLIKALILCAVLLGAFAYMTVIERKLLGRMQHRYGPNRVGPFGLLQPIADAIKSIFKEDVTVKAADKFVFILAPFISIVFALVAFGAIPAGPAGSLFGFNPWVMDLDIALLFVFAATSIGVYGIFLGGWASNSKYALLGSLRASAQMISYELGLGLSALTVIMIAGTLNLRGIVESNIWAVSPWLWIPLVISFITYFISSNAEVNRTPFDMPEAEQEIVAGYLTEYSSIKWALFQMAEYVNMMTASAIIATLFLGGYKGPAFLNQWVDQNIYSWLYRWFPNAQFLPISEWPIIWLVLKMAIFMFIFIWMRATLPRLRYDQLMRLGWIYIFEIALASALICGAIIAFVL